MSTMKQRMTLELNMTNQGVYLYGTYDLELYCQNEACSVREIEVTVKIYDHQDLLTLKNTGDNIFACPVCSNPTKIHRFETA